ncbi:MAG: proton-conducting transporter membrane subunit [Thalassobaculaceae bacterium]|uniref:hydrogen gas-evolving membrane-bound hydrogenase subunit E n=1 Tax=Roseitalea porphyridii TaxID=1852022 RepID=UPI0032EF6454
MTSEHKTLKGGFDAWVFATIALSLAGFAAALSWIPRVSAGDFPSVSWMWVEGLGVDFAFRIDGLALLFVLLITGIGVLVLAYAAAYASKADKRRRLCLLLFAFLVAMLGLVTADDLITLFVFWEATTVISYLLIGFDHEKASARRSALQGLLVTGAGGLALLAGLVILGMEAGTFRLSDLPAALAATDLSDLTVSLVLILAGCFTKSAQFPFHFWLPNAMAAPTPVSAYLHSATMVKAGIYLLARLHPVYADHEIWFPVLTTFGAVTAVWASIQALRQTDLKLMLAHTTVMALGTLTMFLASSSPIAVVAAATFILVHALYKATLFLTVGVIDKRTGTRDRRLLSGLGSVLPLTAVAAFTGAFSMAGFPPFLGFIGKELKYEGALAIAEEPGLVIVAAVAANAMMVAVALVVSIRTFLGKPPERDAGITPPRAMIAVPLLLGVSGLVFGLAPSLIGQTIVVPAASAILGMPADIKLALWHGINVPLMLSILTVALGVAVYFGLGRLTVMMDGIGARVPISGDRVYDVVLKGTLDGAGRLTATIQGGRLPVYVGLSFAVVGLALMVGALGDDAAIWSEVRLEQLLPWEIASLALMAVGAALATAARRRLTALCGLAGVGVGTTLVFLMHGAVDVAVTQFMVEALIVVFVAAVIPKIPPFESVRRTAPQRWLRGILAAFVGLATTLALLRLAPPVDRTITDFYEQMSVPEAFGRNVVNVILVDFRALDTLGEVAVVVVAALGAFALLRGRRFSRSPE